MKDAITYFVALHGESNGNNNLGDLGNRVSKLNRMPDSKMRDFRREVQEYNRCATIYI